MVTLEPADLQKQIGKQQRPRPASRLPETRADVVAHETARPTGNRAPRVEGARDIGHRVEHIRAAHATRLEHQMVAVVVPEIGIGDAARGLELSRERRARDRDRDRQQNRRRIDGPQLFGERLVVVDRVFLERHHHAGEADDPALTEPTEQLRVVRDPIVSFIHAVEALLVE